MRPDQLNDRKVIDSEAEIVGEVCGIEIDISNWKVTDICIDLSDDIIEALGYKKPFLGKVVVNVPVNMVGKVSDVVTINKSILELKNIVERVR